jgi:heme-degrading monooxygenase HmoA
MFVAMNVFTCEDDASAAALEGMFRKRAGLVDAAPGFVAFSFLKQAENPRKLISMTTWVSRADFEAWTKSHAFEKGHARSRESGGGSPHGMMKVSNVLETWEVVSHSEKRTASDGGGVAR